MRSFVTLVVSKTRTDDSMLPVGAGLASRMSLVPPHLPQGPEYEIDKHQKHKAIVCEEQDLQYLCGGSACSHG